MALRQIVNEQLLLLISRDPSQLRLRPEVVDLSIKSDTGIIQTCIYREPSHSGRTIIVVKCFKSRLFWLDAVADGFAITADDAIVELDEEERTSLY